MENNNPDKNAFVGVFCFVLYLLINKTMKEIIQNIQKSFNGANEGYSARKLTAFVIVLCVIAAHIKWITLGDFKQLELVLTIDYGFIASMFGMTTYSAIKMSDKEKKEDKKEDDEPVIEIPK